MNKIFHFGDSYGGTNLENSKHFVRLMSEKMGYGYEHNCIGGSSNEMIFSKLLSNIFRFKSGDILFFNFSFFIRGSYYDLDEKTIMSTNRYVSENSDKNMYGKIQSRFFKIDRLQYMTGILSNLLDYNEDYNRKLFEKFNILFELLTKKEITIYYIFNEDNNFSDDLLKYGNHIKFDNGFCNWLTEMGYHNQEDCHYSIGVQPNIMEHVFNKCPELNKLILPGIK
jgi:hypothetical protein